MPTGDARFFSRSGPHALATVATAAAGRAPPVDLILSGVAPLQTAGPTEVSFLDNRRYAAAALAPTKGEASGTAGFQLGLKLRFTSACGRLSVLCNL